LGDGDEAAVGVDRERGRAGGEAGGHRGGAALGLGAGGPGEVLGLGGLGEGLGGALVDLLGELLHALEGDEQGGGDDEDDGRAEEELALGGQGDLELAEAAEHRGGGFYRVGGGVPVGFVLRRRVGGGRVGWVLGAGILLGL
jgi:hypothetical protein